MTNLFNKAKREAAEAKRLENIANARADAEFEAKYAAKQEKKRVEKMITEIDQSVQSLITKAAAAKQKGYTGVYRQCVSFIKVARARRQQAEMFLFQVDAMQDMKSLADSSKDLLGSMGNIMNTLGKLSMDKEVMMSAQRDFANTQRELEKQTANIDMFLSGMEMSMPDDMGMDASLFSDADIDAEIDSFIVDSTLKNAGNISGEASDSQDAEIDYLKQMLNK